MGPPLDDEETVFYEMKDGVRGTPHKDSIGESVAQWLDQTFVPAHVAPFFFFDGEQVSRLADQSRVEQIKQGLEGLLGVVLLRSLADRLRQFEQNKRPDAAGMDTERLEELYANLQKSDQELSELRATREAADERIEALRHQQATLIERITAAGLGGGDAATAHDILAEQAALEQEYRQAQAKIEELLTQQLPFHLAGVRIREELLSQLHGEQVWLEWDQRKRSLEPERERFKQRLLEVSDPEIQPPLTTKQEEQLAARLEKAWQGFYSPPPEDAKAVVHGYLYGPQRDTMIGKLRDLKLGADEILTPVDRSKAIQERLRALKMRLSKLDGVERDGTMGKIRQEFDDVTHALEEQGKQLRDVERREAALAATVENDRAVYERERDKAEASSPTRALLAKSERVRRIIEEVIPAAFSLKVEALGTAMTEVYKRLAHKQTIKKIEVLPDGSSRVLGRSGHEIKFDRSAGENQLFATALIAGLARVSGVKAPMVVDTPLGRLDSLHRQNILDFWVSDKQRQVILLSQDEEIDQDWFEHIKGSVSKTYLLEHEQVSSEVGRSTASENKYFNIESTKWS